MSQQKDFHIYKENVKFLLINNVVEFLILIELRLDYDYKWKNRTYRWQMSRNDKHRKETHNF